MIPVTNVRDFYVYMVNRHTVHLPMLESSLLLLKLIVNMLALYIKGIEVVFYTAIHHPILYIISNKQIDHCYYNLSYLYIKILVKCLLNW